MMKEPKKMVVLVTGGAGYIGSHMVWTLLDAGEQVIVLDRLSTGFAWAVAPKATLVKGDIGDEQLVASLITTHSIDSIIHFAGSSAVHESVTDPLGYYHNNTCNTRALIRGAISGGIKHFIFGSTGAVYGAAGMEPVDEKAALAPESPYGRSKLMSELMLRDAAAAHGFTYTILRYFNVAGADPHGRAGQSSPGATHLVKVACETALGKRSGLTIFGTDYPTPDGTCVRDYIHVSDLTNVHLLALNRLRLGGESLVANCGYNRGSSVLEVLAAVRRASGRDFKVKTGKRRVGDPSAIVADANLARSTLNWRPAYDDLDQIVSDALAWEEQLATRAPGQ